MTDIVLIANAEAYFLDWRAIAVNKLQKSQDAYNAARVEYEQTWRFRWFKTPFEQTSRGDTSWAGYSNWQMYRYENTMKNIERELNRLEYHKKMGNTTIPWTYNNDSLSDFYAFCKEKGLP